MYYSAIREKEILPFATPWMDLEGIMLSGISHTKREIPYDLANMWNLKTKQNQAHDTDNSLVVAISGSWGWKRVRG